MEPLTCAVMSALTCAVMSALTCAVMSALTCAVMSAQFVKSARLIYTNARYFFYCHNFFALVQCRTSAYNNK